MKRIILISIFVAIFVFSIILECFYPIFNFLDNLDKQVTVSLNFDGGFITDAVMYAMSSRITCSVFILLIIAFFIKRPIKFIDYVVIVLGLTIVITLCDQISASVIKPYVCRLRPSHTDSISDVLHYVYGYKGGQYGFVSSHAANTFGVAAFLSGIIKNKKMALFLFIWAVLVSYSRIYLGVHYFGDVVCGGILGIIIGSIIAFVSNFIVGRYIMYGHVKICKTSSQSEQ